MPSVLLYFTLSLLPSSTKHCKLNASQQTNNPQLKSPNSSEMLVKRQVRHKTPLFTFFPPLISTVKCHSQSLGRVVCKRWLVSTLERMKGSGCDRWETGKPLYWPNQTIVWKRLFYALLRKQQRGYNSKGKWGQWPGRKYCQWIIKHLCMESQNVFCLYCS